MPRRQSVGDGEVRSGRSAGVLKLEATLASALVEVVKQQRHGLPVLGVQHVLFHRVSADLDPNVFLFLVSGGPLLPEKVHARGARSVTQQLPLSLQNVGLGLGLDVGQLVVVDASQLAHRVLCWRASMAQVRVVLGQVTLLGSSLSSCTLVAKGGVDAVAVEVVVLLRALALLAVQGLRSPMHFGSEPHPIDCVSLSQNFVVGSLVVGRTALEDLLWHGWDRDVLVGCHLGVGVVLVWPAGPAGLGDHDLLGRIKVVSRLEL